MTDTISEPQMTDPAMTERSVLVPGGAIAWVHGTERYAGHWAFSEEDVEDAIENGERVVRASETDDWIHGITGHAPLADFMRLAGDVELLSKQLHQLRSTISDAAVLFMVGGKSLKGDFESNR